MPVTTPQSIGRTLARFGRLAGDRGPEDAVASSREAIFHVLSRSSASLTIEEICRDTGLHANTVRSHLEVLHASGRVAREQQPPRGRGRPPLLFAVAPEARSPRQALATSLLEQLEDAPAPGLAQAAARRWADAVDPRTEGSATAETPDAAVQSATEALSDLGFDARVDAVGDRIELRGCPYARLVAERPVICDIHAALLEQLLADSGQPVTLRRLDVWARPTLCVAHLDRPDLVPDRTITPPAAAPSSL